VINRVTGLIVQLIVSVAFVSFGYHAAFNLGKPILDQATQTNGWPKVDGKILSSEVTTLPDSEDLQRENPRDRGPMYSATVLYEYTLDDRTIHSSSIWPGNGQASSSRAEQQGIVDRYLPGQAVPVFYDPEHPESAVLEPGANWTSYILYVVGWIFLILGIFSLITIPRAFMRSEDGGE